MKTTIKIFFSLILIQFFTSFSYPQEPDTLWTKQYGGDSIDVAYDIVELPDGGFAVVGYTNSPPINIPPHTSYDIWLLRTDENGDTLWTRRYGGNEQEYGYSIKETEDGGFIIAGTTNSFGAGGFDYYVIRTDSVGDTLWTKTFGGVNDDYARSVDNTIDGGFVIAGEEDAWPFDADARVIKLDTLGNIIWDKSIENNSEDERILSIKSLSSGKFIAAGMNGCNGYANCQAWLVYLDQIGDTLWTSILSEFYNSQLYAVNSTTDNCIIATGLVLQTNGSYADLLLMKLDATGNVIWSKIIDYDNDSDIGYSVQQTSDGGYIIAGQGHSYD